MLLVLERGHLIFQELRNSCYTRLHRSIVGRLLVSDQRLENDTLSVVGGWGRDLDKQTRTINYVKC